jgi:pumilio RNA-binding family
VIQKLFEHGTQVHKTILANAIEPHIAQLSVQMYACRVVQKVISLVTVSYRLLIALQAIEYILPEQQIAIVKELEPHLLKCVKDANGNHVGLALYTMSSALSDYESRLCKNSSSVYPPSV